MNASPEKRRHRYAELRSTPEGDALYRTASRTAYNKRKKAALAQIRLKTYGITEDNYRQMIKAQNGVCAICGEAETAVRCGKVRDLSIDHCHETGKIRGLLCLKHNALLGMADDSIHLLEQAIAYLKAHKNL